LGFLFSELLTEPSRHKNKANSLKILVYAMKALLKLRASGRMIGIISHVEALKERINN